MNRFEGVVTDIQQSGSIVLVDVDSDGQIFSALVIYALDFPKWLSKGNLVNIIFKETEVSIAVNLSHQISIGNQLPCTVTNIKRGTILTVIDLLFDKKKITSVIGTRSAEKLMLQKGSQVTALIKANEITLAELTDK